MIASTPRELFLKYITDCRKPAGDRETVMRHSSLSAHAMAHKTQKYTDAFVNSLSDEEIEHHFALFCAYAFRQR